MAIKTTDDFARESAMILLGMFCILGTLEFYGLIPSDDLLALQLMGGSLIVAAVIAAIRYRLYTRNHEESYLALRVLYSDESVEYFRLISHEDDDIFVSDLISKYDSGLTIKTVERIR